MVAVADRSIVVRVEQLRAVVSIVAQAAVAVARQARSTVALAREAIAAASATITTIHIAATHRHHQAEVTRVDTRVVVTTQEACTVAVRVEDSSMQ